MVLLAFVIGAVLGVPFGLLLRGLCEANGEDGAAADVLSGVMLRRTPDGAVELPGMLPAAHGRVATLVGAWPLGCRHCRRSLPARDGLTG
jgi:hypothetical protein